MTEAEKARLRVELRRRKEAGSTPDADMSIMGRIKDNLVGVEDGVDSFGEKVGTFFNKMGESASFGVVGDEASAAVAGILPGGRTHDERLAFERGNEERLERDNPGAALAAEIGGGIVGALLPGGAVGTLAKGAGLLPKVAASAGTGAAMGGVYGAMEGETPEERASGLMEGAQWGAGAGFAAPIAGAGVQRVANSVLKNRAIRRATKGASRAADQRTASGRSYSAFEEAGAEISPEAMSRLRMQVVDALNDGGMSKIPSGRKLTPGGQTIIDAVSEMDDQVRAAASRGENPAVPLTAIEDLRRVASDVAQDVNPIGRATRDARLGSVAIDEIDTFVETLQQADVPIGDPQEAVAALKKARSLWSQSTKTQLLDNVLEAQDNYLGGPASAIRNKTASLLRNPKTASKFSEAEKEVLKRIIGGNSVSRAVRLLGNGIGRQAQMAGGAALGGIPGVIAGTVTGELTGAIADRNATKAAEVARALVANGGLPSVPQAPDTVRRITEALSRRIGAGQSH